MKPTTHVAPELRKHLVPLARLVPDPASVRKHPHRSLEAIQASLRRFGQQKPIVVDAKGVVLAGNGVLEAAKQLGWTHIAAVQTKLSGADRVAFAIADNRTAELSVWDEEALAAQLRGMSPADIDSLGFTIDELAELAGRPSTRVDPDHVPAPPDAPETSRDDVWILGAHRLMCGDSANAADVDRLLAGDRVHVVHTDPPYNVKVEPRSNNAIAAGLSSFQATHHQRDDAELSPHRTKATHSKLRAKDRPLANDFVSDAQFDHLLKGWFGNIARTLVPGGAFYIWGGYANCGNYPPVLRDHALYFAQAIIWVKEHPVLTRKDFMGNHEWCFYGWKDGAAHRFFGAKNIPDTWVLAKEPQMLGRRRVLAIDLDDERTRDLPSDVWKVKKVPPNKMVHLTEKPVALTERALRYSSLPGEVVLDLFGGSGSTLIGAELCQRKARLMELDPLYCDVIVRRFEEVTGKKAIRTKR